MIFILSFLIFCFVFYAIYKYDPFLYSLCGSIVISALPIFLLIIISWEFSPLKEYKRERVNVEIASLDLKSGVSGSFFLGRGSFDSKSSFFYYYKDEYGRYVLGREFSWSVAIEQYSDTQEKPKMYWDVIYSKVPYWVFFDVIGEEKVESQKVFRIPEGSIKYEFNPMVK